MANAKDQVMPPTFSPVRAAGRCASTSLSDDYLDAPSSRRDRFRAELELLADAEREEKSNSANLTL